VTRCPRICYADNIEDSVREAPSSDYTLLKRRVSGDEIDLMQPKNMFINIHNPKWFH